MCNCHKSTTWNDITSSKWPKPKRNFWKVLWQEFVEKNKQFFRNFIDCKREAQVYCEECKKNLCMDCIQKIHSIIDHSSPLIPLDKKIAKVWMIEQFSIHKWNSKKRSNAKKIMEFATDSAHFVNNHVALFVHLKNINLIQPQ